MAAVTFPTRSPKTTDRPVSKTRRWALGGLVSGAVAAASAAFAKPRSKSASFWLRPPGAVPEKRTATDASVVESPGGKPAALLADTGPSFTDLCSRCFKCGNACKNGCISFFGLADGLELAFTPYLKARARGCILCGDCADVCPSGALQPFGTTREDWVVDVDMGLAHVNKDLCYSFHGRTCGACYRACPIAGTAMKIGVFETPYVQTDACVGCGLCEQACLHLPQAIRVIPRRMMGSRQERMAAKAATAAKAKAKAGKAS